MIKAKNKKQNKKQPIDKNKVEVKPKKLQQIPEVKTTCPTCNGNSLVYCTKNYGTFFVRYRKCKKCKHTFKTKEYKVY